MREFMRERARTRRALAGVPRRGPDAALMRRSMSAAPRASPSRSAPRVRPRWSARAWSGRALVGRTEARLCVTGARRRTTPRTGREALHETLWVADLHADSLLWGRDLLQRATRGHVDVPRLREGNVALQVLAATTKSPRHLNIERNDDRSDDVVLLALALGLAAARRGGGCCRGRSTWPPAPTSWRRAPVARSGSSDRARDLADYEAARRARAAPHRRAPRDRGRPRARRRPGERRGRRRRGLSDDVAEPLLRQRLRRVGARHRQGRPDRRRARDGPADGGARDAGRRRPRLGRDDRRRPGDGDAAGRRLAHGFRGVADNSPQPDRRAAARRSRRPAGCSASGSGRPPAVATMRRRSPGRSATRSNVAGIEHVGLGSDFDGAVPVPFDATGLVA